MQTYGSKMVIVTFRDKAKRNCCKQETTLSIQNCTLNNHTFQWKQQRLKQPVLCQEIFQEFPALQSFAHLNILHSLHIFGTH